MEPHRLTGPGPAQPAPVIGACCITNDAPPEGFWRTPIPTTPNHRKDQLRDRLLHQPDSLTDPELLELVLGGEDDAPDMRPLAAQLLRHFGDFNRVVSANPLILAKHIGHNSTAIAALKLVKLAALRLSRAKLLCRPVLSDWKALLDYCHISLGHCDIEQMHVLFLDRKNALIADEIMGRGTVHHVPVYPREILRRALMLNASALILVHNHPSGDPEPSEADISMTDEVMRSGTALGITLHDHLIIGATREVSFRSAGLL